MSALTERATRVDPTSRGAMTALVVASVLTVALYFVPYGQYVIYPLMLFSTYVHEMGHGITAIVMGGEFVNFKMWANGSGVAQHRGYYEAFDMAVIAAGGLLGPAIGGAIFFLLGRRTWTSRIGLYVFTVVSVLSVALVVRNGFGVGFVLAVAAICALVAHWAPAGLAQVVTVFLGVQLTLSVFSRGDYLFMEYAETSQGRMPSDVSQISNALGGPYWLWGGFVGLLSIAVLGFGLYLFFRNAETPDEETAPAAS